ncbi:hypothetical protein [Vibrio parahaemolyticus]|uniref:hypothetical protein n=1 Tax=Vibrio parahaemolyticus TaxID=670 RepID=UPI001E2F106A|nr:hypothetical protein [Vibrio parahaemolyticus]
MFKSFVALLPLFLIGCTSNTYEVNIKYELYVAAEREALDYIYDSIQKEVNLNPKSEFVITPTKQKAIFCLTENESAHLLVQCMAVIPYYGDSYCDDVVAFVDKEFEPLNVEMETVSGSYTTCQKGEYSDYAEGGKTHFILEFEGYYSETKINWESISNDIGRLFYKGNCYLPSDIAADGSRCGGRAATARSGGY